MEHTEIRLYGFSHILDFPCMCVGKKAFVLKIQWSKVKKRFYCYHWIASASDVITNIGNGANQFRFFGFMLIKGYRAEINYGI